MTKPSKKPKNTGGRPKGSLNKSTIEIRELCRSYAADACAELWKLARNAQSEQARVAAIKELLDRGYGKSAQPIDGDGEGGPIKASIKVTFVKPGH